MLRRDMVQYPFPLDPEFVGQLWQRLERVLSGRTVQTTGSLLPSVDDLTDLLQASFWASLQKEENRPVTFSVAFIPPDAGPNAYVFEEAVPFSPESLVKLAPALQISKAHIGIWPDTAGELVIWGFTNAPTV